MQLNLLSLLAGMILLSGCATAGSNPVYLTRCPDLAVYSQTILDRAARELSSMPPDAALPYFMADYAALRQACREAAGRVS